MATSKKPARSAEYWRARMERQEVALRRPLAAVQSELVEMFERADREIQRELRAWYQTIIDTYPDGLTEANARRLLRGQELDEFKWNVDQYAKAAAAGNMSPEWQARLTRAQAGQRISRLEAIELEMREKFEVIAARQQGLYYDTLAEGYREAQGRTAFETQRAAEIGWQLSGVNDREIEKILSRPWDPGNGQLATFSDRIWADKEKMIGTLSKELSRAILLGEPLTKGSSALAQFSRDVKSGEKVAERLLRTEHAYIVTEAQKEMFKELDVDLVRIVVSLDEKTCEICGPLDEADPFPLTGVTAFFTSPPFHPNCRCILAPWIDNEYGERAARNPDTGKTEYVPATMTYRQWREKYLPDPT